MIFFVGDERLLWPFSFAAVAVGWSLIASGQRLLLPEKHSRYTYIKVLSPPRPVVAELISLFTAKCLEKYPKELLLFKMT